MNANEILERRCPVCGGGAARPALVKGNLRLVRCLDCGMTYANPVPASFATGDFYDHSGAYYLSEAKLRGDFAAVRFARELRLFRARCASGRVLDVGCSTGAFLHQLRNRYPGDYELLGTDVAGPALDHAASLGIPVLRGDFLEQEFAEAFDAVTFWAVVEHLVHPRAFLEKAHGVLKPGGCCFVLVPNYRSLAVRLLGARYRYILPQHVNYFTAETLGNLATRCGFTVASLTASHFNPMVLWRDWRGGAQEVPNEERAALLQRTTALKENRALAPVRIAYQATESLLAKSLLADNLVAVLRRAGGGS